MPQDEPGYQGAFFSLNIEMQYNPVKISFAWEREIGVGVIVDGCPPRLPLSTEDIQRELNRRKPGQSRLTTPRDEEDIVEILSGTVDGITTGSPISMLVRNKDQRSKDYEDME
eukprot:gene41702-56460_t